MSNQKVLFISVHKQCENSSFLSSKLKKYFSENGIATTSDMKDADFICLNICSVSDSFRCSAERYAIQLSNSLPKTKKIIITGCFFDKLKDEIRDYERTLFVRANELEKLDEFISAKNHIKNIQNSKLDSSCFIPYQSKVGADDNYIQISSGCVNDCTYCNIKKTRVALISKPLQVVVKEARQAISNGQFTLTLLSDDCGSYGLDIGENILLLLSSILELDSRIRLKIYNMHPALLIKYYPGLKEHIKNKKITYLCIPLQSGSERILKLMNREYDIEKIASIIKDIRNLHPALWLYTNFIYSFPTESLNDFESSIKLSNLFDEVLFLPYFDNILTDSHLIEPKNTRDEYLKKTRMLEALQKTGTHNLTLVRSPITENDK